MNIKFIFKSFVVILLLFTIGFFSSYFIYKPKKNHTINIYDHELKSMNQERDLIKFPKLYNSSIKLDAFFLDNNNDKDLIKNNITKKSYSIILNKEESLKSKLLCLKIKYPIKNDNKNENIFYTIQDFNQAGLKGKIVNISKYEGIIIPIKIELGEKKIKIKMKLTLSIAISPTNLRDEIEINSAYHEIQLNDNYNEISFYDYQFKKFKINNDNQIYEMINKKEKIKYLDSKRNKGFLLNIKLSFDFFDKTKNVSEINGVLYLGNPTIYYNASSIFKTVIYYIFGSLLSIIGLIFIIFLNIIQKLNNKMIEVNTITNYINKKERDIKDLEVAITRKIGIDKEIVRGIKGYYHWELQKYENSNFIGINKEDFFTDGFLDSFFFEDYKKQIKTRTIILIIDYDPENINNHNYLFYYNPEGIRIKFSNISITRKSYWFYLLAFLIQTPKGYIKMSKLNYDNILFRNIPGFSEAIPCLRIPQNNNDLGIDNENYLKLVKRYNVNNIISVSRKQKLQEITYNLNREINYTLFIHSKFISHSAFNIKDYNIVDFYTENFLDCKSRKN